MLFFFSFKRNDVFLKFFVNHSRKQTKNPTSGPVGRLGSRSQHLSTGRDGSVKEESILLLLERGACFLQPKSGFCH